MMLAILWIWAIAATVWAALATIIIVRNPLPFAIPDRGHRAFGVPDDKTRQIVVGILSEVGKLRKRFTFVAGPTHQTLMQDNYTVINFVEGARMNLTSPSGNGLSLAVDDPMRCAKRAVEILKAANYTTNLQEIVDDDLPSNHLVIIESSAFKEWALVFRRPILKMPKPKFLDS